MQINKDFAKNPNSKTSPPGVVDFKIINRQQQALEGHQARFAYLDEYERIEAERAGDAFCDAKKIISDQHRGQVRRAFLVAAFLKDFTDIDKAFFMTMDKIVPGEVALRKLGYPTAVQLYQQWGKWMDAEFLTDVLTGEERAPTDEEASDLEGQAAGE